MLPFWERRVLAQILKLSAPGGVVWGKVGMATEFILRRPLQGSNESEEVIAAAIFAPRCESQKGRNLKCCPFCQLSTISLRERISIGLDGLYRAFGFNYLPSPHAMPRDTKPVSAVMCDHYIIYDILYYPIYPPHVKVPFVSTQAFRISLSDPAESNYRINPSDKQGCLSKQLLSSTL